MYPGGDDPERRIAELERELSEQKRIADKLSGGRYVVNPEVQVTLMQVNSRQVSVLGNVNKPGRYPIDNINTRLTDFIAAAGGVAAPCSDLVTVVSTK